MFAEQHISSLSACTKLGDVWMCVHEVIAEVDSLPYAFFDIFDFEFFEDVFFDFEYFANDGSLTWSIV